MFDHLVDSAEQWLRKAAGEPVPECTQVAAAAANAFRSAALEAASKRRSSSKEPADAAPQFANPDGAKAEAGDCSAESPASPGAPGAVEAAPAVANAFSLDLGTVSGSFWEPVYTKPRKTPRGAQSTRSDIADADGAAAAAADEAAAGAASPKKRASLGRVAAAAHATALLNKKRPASARLPFSGGSKASAPDATRPATARESRSPTRRPAGGGGAAATGGARLASQSQSASRSPNPGTRRSQATAALLQSAGGLGGGAGVGAGAGAGDSRGASPSKSPAALRPGTSTTSTLIDTPSSVAVLSNQTGTSSSGRPFFGDRPTAPFRDAFRRKPRLTEQSKKGKPSPSSFIHPSTTPLSSVQSAVRLPPSYMPLPLPYTTATSLSPSPFHHLPSSPS